jgi:hypothetical protein
VTAAGTAGGAPSVVTDAQRCRHCQRPSWGANATGPLHRCYDPGSVEHEVAAGRPCLPCAASRASWSSHHTQAPRVSRPQ